MNFRLSFFSWEFVAIPCRASLFDAQSQSCSFVVSVCFMHKIISTSCQKYFTLIKAIFTMMSFYHCYKNSTFVYLSHWNVQQINPIDIKTIKKSYRDINQHLKQKLQFNNLIYKWKKMYTFLRKKLKLIKKKNCLLNELNFITDSRKFL